MAKKKITKEQAYELLKDRSPREVFDEYKGFSMSQLAAYKAWITMRANKQEKRDSPEKFSLYIKKGSSGQYVATIKEDGGRATVDLVDRVRGSTSTRGCIVSGSDQLVDRIQELTAKYKGFENIPIGKLYR